MCRISKHSAVYITSKHCKLLLSVMLVYARSVSAFCYVSKYFTVLNVVIGYSGSVRSMCSLSKHYAVQVQLTSEMADAGSVSAVSSTKKQCEVLTTVLIC